MRGSMADRTVYHVVPVGNRWAVTVEGKPFRADYATKIEAEDAAGTRARSEEPSQVKVHLANGRIEYESTYGDDPRSTPG